jgi:outer membrane autotransporter protein
MRKTKKILCLLCAMGSCFAMPGLLEASGAKVINITSPDNFSYSSGSELVDNEQVLQVYLTSDVSGQTINSYTVDATLGGTSGVNPTYGMRIGLNGAEGATVNNVNINMTGSVTDGYYAISVLNDVNLNNVVINSDVVNYTDVVGSYLATAELEVRNGTANIHNLYINSELDPKNARIAAHNGLYVNGDGSYVTSDPVANVTGDVYINVNMSGLAEIYDGNYGLGVTKNDAVSGKYGGTVYINVNEDGSVNDPSAKVQIFGNIDVKGNSSKQGHVVAYLSGPESFWHGAEVGGITYDTTTHEYGDLNPYGTLELTLSDMAQWVPDILPVDDGGDPNSRSAYISAITLNDNGVINMHGLNKHTNADETVNNLTVYNLTTNNGILRMDANGSQGDSTHLNGSDFITIREATSTTANNVLYVQPLDGSKLAGISASNPVRIGDAPESITMVGLESSAALVEGTLYDYTPIIAKNVDGDVRYGIDEINGVSRNDWYIVGVVGRPNETVYQVVSSYNLMYGDLVSHRAIDTLNQRMGELRDYEDTEDGIWVRWKTGEMEAHKYGKYEYDYDFFQVGYDKRIETKNGIWHVGAAGHRTNGDVDYRLGSGDLDSYGASLYAGWTGKKGHYADYVLQTEHYRNKFQLRDGAGAIDAAYSDRSYSASAEYGRKNNLSHDWFFEPQAQLVYSYLGDVHYTLSNGVRAYQDSLSSVIGRLGFRIGRTLKNGNEKHPNEFYFKLNALHEFMGDRTIGLWGIDGSTFRQEAVTHDTWYLAGLGYHFNSGKLSWYGDIEKSFGGDITTKWQFNTGLRWSW